MNTNETNVTANCPFNFVPTPDGAPDYFSIGEFGIEALKLAKQHPDWAPIWDAAEFNESDNEMAECCSCIMSDRFAPIAGCGLIDDHISFFAILTGYNVSHDTPTEIYIGLWNSPKKPDDVSEDELKKLSRIYEDAVYRVVQENQDRFDER